MASTAPAAQSAPYHPSAGGSVHRDVGWLLGIPGGYAAGTNTSAGHVTGAYSINYGVIYGNNKSFGE